MKTLSCREAGFDCDHVVKGENEEEVMRKWRRARYESSWYESRRHNSRNETENKRTNSERLIIFYLIEAKNTFLLGQSNHWYCYK